MNTALRVVPAIVAMCVGCAKAELRLKLDIYSEDPRQELPISAASRTALHQVLDRIVQVSDTLVRDRRQLAVAAFDLYEAIYRFTIEANLFGADPPPEYDSADLDILRRHREEHAAVNQVRFDTLAMRVRDVQRLTMTGSASVRAVETAVDVVASAFNTLTAPTTTDFDDTLLDRLDALGRAITAENLGTEPAATREREVAALRSRLEGVAALMSDIAARNAQQDTLVTELTRVTGSLAPEPVTLRASLDSLIEIATSLPASARATDRGTSGIASILASTDLLFSQIDRLQDPGDPVWMVLADPDNDSNWTKDFSETYFKGEGAADVVVVRDSPRDYRVLRGANDPSELIQGQLAITRALVSSAITVLSPVIGAPLAAAAAPPPEGAEGEDPGDANGVQDAARRAEITERSRLRGQAIETLRRRIYELVLQLRALSPGQEQEAQDIMTALGPQLEAYKRVLSGCDCNTEADANQDPEQPGNPQ